MRSLPLERPPSARCASARGAQTHGGDACSRDCSGPDGQSHEELLQVGPTRCVRGHWYIRGSGAIRSRAQAGHRDFFDHHRSTGVRAEQAWSAKQPNRGSPLSLLSSGRLQLEEGHAHGGEWTCGGRANTPPTTSTCRSSPRPTAGRLGPRRCGPAASTAPPRCPPTPRRCRCWPPGPTPTVPYRPTCADHPDGAASRPPTSAPSNLLHAATRGPAERGISLLKALRRVSLCPRRIGVLTAALVLHHQHGRAT